MAGSKLNDMNEHRKDESESVPGTAFDTKRWLGRVSAALLILIGGVCLNYAVDIYRARSLTPELIGDALRSGAIVLEVEDLSLQQRRAWLGVQDPNFFQHPGWDFASGRITTITQALVKVYYFEQFRPGIAKIRQSLIARFALDPLVSKEDQLRLFINNDLSGHDRRCLRKRFPPGSRGLFREAIQGLDLR